MRDYGAAQSIRQRAADRSFGHFFQKMDRSSIEATIRGAIVRGYVDYLDDCGLDTSELREQRNMILNQGIMIERGNLSAGNIAVGTRASVNSPAGSHESIGSD
jgi:hypothetical protein